MGIFLCAWVSIMSWGLLCLNKNVCIRPMEDIQREIFNYVTNAASTLLTSGLLVTVVISARRNLTDDTFSGLRAGLAHLCWEGEVHLPSLSPAVCPYVPAWDPELVRALVGYHQSRFNSPTWQKRWLKKVVFCCVSGCDRLMKPEEHNWRGPVGKRVWERQAREKGVRSSLVAGGYP